LASNPRGGTRETPARHGGFGVSAVAFERVEDELDAAPELCVAVGLGEGRPVCVRCRVVLGRERRQARIEPGPTALRSSECTYPTAKPQKIRYALTASSAVKPAPCSAANVSSTARRHAGEVTVRLA
jgi:hypothetical protein